MEPGLKWRICAALAALATGLFIGLTSAGADPTPPAVDDHPSNGLCLACHDQKLTIGAGTGQQRTIDSVEQQTFSASAHEGMECVECHPVQSALPHAKREGPELLNASAVVACQECHSEAHEGYLDSPHGTMTKLGDARAPACLDCHGNAHYLPLVKQWTAHDRAEVCANCHSGATSSFLDTAPLHKSVSPGFQSTAYVAGLFLMILTATTLAFAIIHVELEMLRWFVHRLVGGRGTGTTGDGHAG
ncbi:MAG: hypothetical protein V3S20_05465 [Dehalococcoidia bacterium]